MQSLYSVIKDKNVIKEGNKEISTDFIPKKNKTVMLDEDEQKNKENIASYMENYESLARIMIENARRKSEAMMSEAYREAQQLEKDAYEKGYKDGYNAGKEQAYNDALPKAQNEASKIIKDANNLLFESKKQYEHYMELKREEIVLLVINTAQHILKNEIKDKTALNSMIKDVIKESRNNEVIIIKVSKHYVDEIKASAADWKETMALRSEIFVLPDETIGEGNVLIEKDNGTIKLGVDTGLEAIRNELFSLKG